MQPCVPVSVRVGQHGHPPLGPGDLDHPAGRLGFRLEAGDRDRGAIGQDLLDEVAGRRIQDQGRVSGSVEKERAGVGS
jgi:hypothetical protein